MPPASFLLSHKDGTNGSMEAKCFDDELSRIFVNIQKGLSHAHVGCHASLERNGFHEILSFSDVAHEVTGQGIAETGNDVVIGCGNLLKMDHVRFRKDTAPACNARRVLGFQGELSKFLNGQAETAGLLIQERARPRGTQRVHGEIADLEVSPFVLEENQFGVFTAHVDNRPDLWIKMLDRLALGDDLVHKIPADKLCEEFPSCPRKRD
jgi:hypothetical protein